MSKGLSLSATARVREDRVAGFQQLFGTVLMLEALAGLALIFFASRLALSFGIEGPSALRLCGGLLLWAVAFQAAGWMTPVFNRLAVTASIAGHVGVGALCLCLGSSGLIPGLAAIAIGLALFMGYHRMVTAVLMSRP